MLGSPRLLRLAILGVLASLAVAADLHAAACPTAVHFVPDGVGPVLAAGWTGQTHGVPTNGTALDLWVSCGAAMSPCGTCAVTGPLADPPGSPWRCTNDTSIGCTVASEVIDCGAPDTCRYYLSPPQALATGGLTFCATLAADGTVNGSVGVETGDLTVTLPVHTTVALGVTFSGQGGQPNQGCPRCEGDVTPNDGVRDGTCDAGTRQGLACDANATSALEDFGSTSFDCPPSPTNEVLLVTPPLTLSTSTQSLTLTTDSPKCTGTGFTSLYCACSTCNNANTEPCAVNADCPPSGGNPGVCGGKRCMGGGNNGAPCTQPSECPAGSCNRAGVPTQPHACQDNTTSVDDCIPDGEDGTCSMGPVEQYCLDHPNRPCGNDDQCDGTLGSCHASARRCFPDNGKLGGTIAAAGTATAPIDGVAIPTVLGAVTCVRHALNPFIGNGWGLPGPGRLRQPGTLLFDDADLPPCPASPDNCRTPFVPQKASLDLKDRSPDDKDQLAWKWLRGRATTLPEFGQPTTASDYALCIYDDSGLRAAMVIPAGGTCGARPCWQAKSTGFRYHNSSGAPNGIVDLQLRAGVDGKAQIQAKGKGLALPMPPLTSLTTTVQVQLRNRASGRCWGASYTPPFERATSEQLRDHAD